MKQYKHLIRRAEFIIKLPPERIIQALRDARCSIPRIDFELVQIETTRGVIHEVYITSNDERLITLWLLKNKVV